MKFSFIAPALLFLMFAPSGAAQTAKPREFDRAHPWGTELELRFQRGDDPAWARPDFDDRNWQRIGRRDLPSHDGIYWIRARVMLAADRPERSLDAVAVAMVASYDLYWDGQLIGRNGIVGADRASELPGAVDQVFPVSEALLGPGEHVVAFRLSSFYTGFPTRTYGLLFGPTTQRAYFTARSRAAAFAIVAVGGAFVLGALLLLVGLLVYRRPAAVLLGLVCLSAAFVQGLQAWRGLFHYPYDWHYPRIVVLIASVALLGCLLVAFVAVFFQMKRPWLWVAAFAAVAMMIIGGNFIETNVILGGLWWITLVHSSGLATWALWRGQTRAVFVLGGLLVSCAILARSSVDFREQSFLFGMGATVLGCVVALSVQLRADREAARQAQLTAARLEIELLKKNIQPHFLLNSLTTLVEVIECEPRTAITLIEALAAEFRLLVQISGERLVPMRQELTLCREHLRVMSLRRDIRYTLRTEQVDEDALVPPAVFLTLVENGLTHARARRGEVEFVLRSFRDGDTERHVFLSPCVGGMGAEGPESMAPADAAVEGTGSRYIKARLEESFAGRWTFSSGPTSRGWETMIECRRVRSVEVIP